jgi:hypothetical protein
MLSGRSILAVVVVTLLAIILLVVETLSGFTVTARNKGLALPTALPERDGYRITLGGGPVNRRGIATIAVRLPITEVTVIAHNDTFLSMEREPQTS